MSHWGGQDLSDKDAATIAETVRQVYDHLRFYTATNREVRVEVDGGEEMKTLRLTLVDARGDPTDTFALITEDDAGWTHRLYFRPDDADGHMRLLSDPKRYEMHVMYEPTGSRCPVEAFEVVPRE